LPEYVEDIAQQMASLPFPKSSSTERTYNIGVLKLIDYEAIESLK